MSNDEDEVRTLRIEIPWMGPSTNKIWSGNLNRFKRAELARNCKEIVYLATLDVLPFPGRYEITFFPRVNSRFFDTGNYSVTAKAIEDGLVTHGMLVDDSPKYCRGWHLMPPRKVKSESYMIILITEVAEDES